MLHTHIPHTHTCRLLIRFVILDYAILEGNTKDGRTSTGMSYATLQGEDISCYSIVLSCGRSVILRPRRASPHQEMSQQLRIHKNRIAAGVLGSVVWTHGTTVCYRDWLAWIVTIVLTSSDNTT